MVLWTVRDRLPPETAAFVRQDPQIPQRRLLLGSPVRVRARVVSKSAAGLRVRCDSRAANAYGSRMRVSLRSARRAKTRCRVRSVREPCTQRTHLHLTLPRRVPTHPSSGENSFLGRGKQVCARQSASVRLCAPQRTRTGARRNGGRGEGRGGGVVYDSSSQGE